MTTTGWNQRSENDREKPFDPFEEEGDSPFMDNSVSDTRRDIPSPGFSDPHEDVTDVDFTDAGSTGDDRPAEPSGDRFDKPAQLDLGDDDQRLPWLEGDPEEDNDRGGGSGQIVLLGLVAVALLAIVVGGIWWATRAGSNTELVADGGTIEAPDGPYKERPEDPGGRVANGTGDTAFAVAEGQTRPMRVGESEPAPGPGFDSVTPQPSASATPAPSASATPAAPSGPGVQVGAYTDRDSAERGWQALSAQYEGLSGMRYRIVEGQADIGKVYRLQALPGDSGAAQKLCNGLKAARIPCQVKN